MAYRLPLSLAYYESSQSWRELLGQLKRIGVPMVSEPLQKIPARDVVFRNLSPDDRAWIPGRRREDDPCDKRCGPPGRPWVQGQLDRLRSARLCSGLVRSPATSGTLPDCRLVGYPESFHP